MAREYGIREFLFYDWFADYSSPTRGEVWRDPFFRAHDISFQALRETIAEIRRIGGRAWAYVQALAAEEADLENPQADIWKLRTSSGHEYRHPPDAPRFSTYFLNAAWARFMVQRWAPAVKALGFDGIHWDTLGPLAGDRGAEVAGLHAFIRAAHEELTRLGLKQTVNFVDLHGWDPHLVKQACEFPYAEVWSEESRARYYQAMQDPAFRGVHGIIAMYPKAFPATYATESDFFQQSAIEALRHGLFLVIVGDGERRLKHEYWPDTVPLSPEEKQFYRRLAERAVISARGRKSTAAAPQASRPRSHESDRPDPD